MNKQSKGRDTSQSVYILVAWRRLVASFSFIAIALLGSATLSSAYGLQAEPMTDSSLSKSQQSIQAEKQQELEDAQLQATLIRDRRMRVKAHADMPSTMYASTASENEIPPHAIPSDVLLAWDALQRQNTRLHEFRSRNPSHSQRNTSLTIASSQTKSSSTTDTRTRNSWQREEQVTNLSSTSTLLQPLSLAMGQNVELLSVPYLPAASDPNSLLGVVRLVNRSNEEGVVTIKAFDDEGNSYEPINLAVAGRQTVEFTSEDLEYGNEQFGLAGIGAGQGAWRLELSTRVAVDLTAYVQSANGFLSTLHDTIPIGNGTHKGFLFNTASHFGHTSLLRLVNPSDETAEVRIRGTDETGNKSSFVTVFVPPQASRIYTAADLESGAAAGLEGSLGEGSGTWRLSISSSQNIVVLNLLQRSNGDLANLSSLPANASNGMHLVPLFPATSNPHGWQGYVRVTNKDQRSGEVSIQAFDQTTRTYETIVLSLDAESTVHFDSNDLEFGAPSKGITGSTGAGEGDWWLELTSNLTLEVASYVRTVDGFLTAMHHTVPMKDGLHHIALFNPNHDEAHIGALRLVNPNPFAASATISGIDESGALSDSVRVTVPAGSSKTLTASQLEAGDDTIQGQLGKGLGAWRLNVQADQPITIMSLLTSPSGQLANLSTPPIAASGTSESAEDVFTSLISPIVQSKCIYCHVAGGVSGHTRLVFVSSSTSGHLATNLQAFQDFNDNVEDGANLILNKIQGVGHGGGLQVAADTDEFAAMKRFLALLGEEVSTEPSLSVDNLFEGVALEPAWQTLRRAAIVFAGRTPIRAEYAMVESGEIENLRTAIRNLMQGPGFHDFLIRAANDRLLTDRELDFWVIDEYQGFVDYTNERYRLTAEAIKSGDDRALNRFESAVQYAAAREPLELIAHVVENDLPYTDILTADYTMANPWSAFAYRSGTKFDDENDADEFKPSRILGHYRKGDDFESTYDPNFGTQITNSGSLLTDFPHAGVLNTKALMQRYPSTATNRNRARSRWTYYHFLGLDIENSASRTTDPDALIDTNNPTMHNPACTVCHSVLDPVAGAYQNFGDDGLYRDKWGGMDSLDEFYKELWSVAENSIEITGKSSAERQSIKVAGYLHEGNELLRLRPRFDPPEDEDDDLWWDMAISQVSLRHEGGTLVETIYLQDIAEAQDLCGEHEAFVDGSSGESYYGAYFCPQDVLIAIPSNGRYEVEALLWEHASSQDAANRRRIVDLSIGRYQEGDTWYRDMRKPGFQSESPEASERSLPWLAQKIVTDERFAEAAVRFWWPSIMGEEVAESPADENDADFEGRLLAATAMQNDIARLATDFQKGFHDGSAYNLKDLLVEIVLTNWFRAASLDDDDETRAIALSSAGARRLLTPEELSAKTLSLTGYKWQRDRGEMFGRPHERGIGGLTGEYQLLYGGIDSAGVTERAVDLTSMMDSVAQSHAAESACPIVLRELYMLPEDQRWLFRGVDRHMTPTREFADTFEIQGASRSDIETVTVQGSLSAGEIAVRLVYLNDYYGSEGDRDLLLDRLTVKRGTESIYEVEMESLDTSSDCYHVDRNALHLSSGGIACAIDIPVTIPNDGAYQVAVDVWGDQAGDEAPQLQIAVNSDTERSAGSVAIRTHLANLVNEMHGLRVDPSSTIVTDVYALFVDVWREIHTTGHHFLWHRGQCSWWNDGHIFDGINDSLWSTVADEDGNETGFDWEAVEAYFDEIDLDDSEGIGKTWVAVLAHLMMDYRYVHLY